MCDGKVQCPDGDDESLCGILCPLQCLCTGYTADCRSSDISDKDWQNMSAALRAVDVSNNPGITEIRCQHRHQFLIKLNVSYCSVRNLSDEFLNSYYFPNLKVLDLRHNKISVILSRTFSSLRGLKILRLEGNHYLKEIETNAFIGLKSLKELTLSGLSTPVIRAKTFSGLDIDVLDMSDNKIISIESFAFHGLKVTAINLESNDIKHFDKDMFTGVLGVERMRMPAYKFCCVRPNAVEEESCTPPKDEFSSCEDLMRNPILQTLLWLIGVCALLGNILSLAYRVLCDRTRFKIGYGIFVTNLAVADFLMGCYMTIIAIADVSFRQRYLWLDEYWRSSGWCTLAGVLSTTSSEASVLFICLITLDRLLVIKFPFGRIRFKARTAWFLSAVVWVITITAALLPVLHVDYFQDQFYAKSAVCLALPITQDRSSGWLYSVVLFIGVNFVTFVVIAIGQLMIYNEVKSTEKARVRMTGRRQDLNVARNLLLVASTDFLCWFPIGCMGLIALAGHAIPGDVYAWAAVLILPVNSALNPFLYTLSAVIGKKVNPNTATRASGVLYPVNAAILASGRKRHT